MIATIKTQKRARIFLSLMIPIYPMGLDSPKRVCGVVPDNSIGIIDHCLGHFDASQSSSLVLAPKQYLSCRRFQ